MGSGTHPLPIIIQEQPYLLLKLWNVISMVIWLEVKSRQHRNCHVSFSGPFDPIWGFFVSSEKFDSYWIHLSCRVLFYFFLLEIKSEL